MKNFKKILILLLIGVLFISGCSNGKDKVQTNKSNDEIIEYIDNSLYELSNDSLNDYNELISKIETATDSEFQKDSGSGRYILEFKYNDHISFKVFGIPIESWVILLDDEQVIENHS
jgi:hypothetical protein